MCPPALRLACHGLTLQMTELKLAPVQGRLTDLSGAMAKHTISSGLHFLDPYAVVKKGAVAAGSQSCPASTSQRLRLGTHPPRPLSVAASTKSHNASLTHVAAEVCGIAVTAPTHRQEEGTTTVVLCLWLYDTSYAMEAADASVKAHTQNMAVHRPGCLQPPWQHAPTVNKCLHSMIPALPAQRNHRSFSHGPAVQGSLATLRCRKWSMPSPSSKARSARRPPKSIRKQQSEAPQVQPSCESEPTSSTKASSSAKDYQDDRWSPWNSTRASSSAED